MEGCHRDDDKTNNALPNLRWDTRLANVQDAVRNGHHNSTGRWADHDRQWWSDASALYAEGLTTIEIGERLGRNPASVYKVLKKLGVPMRTGHTGNLAAALRRQLTPGDLEKLVDLLK
jgi:hypothetical protein